MRHCTTSRKFMDSIPEYVIGILHCLIFTAYFAAISLFRSRLLSTATKILLYKTPIRPVVTYGVKGWTKTKKEEQTVLTFGRKIFRRIYGLKYENGEWKSRTNRELEEMSKGENTVKWIKGQRISWLGHLERMDDRMPKKIFT